MKFKDEDSKIRALERSLKLAFEEASNTGNPKTAFFNNFIKYDNCVENEVLLSYRLRLISQYITPYEKKYSGIVDVEGGSNNYDPSSKYFS